MILRKTLWAKGIRYRINYRVPGCRPDIVFPGNKIAVFVDGCFWHGCPDHYVRPRSRTDFWDKKLRSNVERDRRQTIHLEDKGWKVLRFWEHEVHIALGVVIKNILAALSGSEIPRPDNWRVVAVEPGDKELEKRFLESLYSDQTRVIIERKRSTKKW